jgi:serine protease Do
MAASNFPRFSQEELKTKTFLGPVVKRSPRRKKRDRQFFASIFISITIGLLLAVSVGGGVYWKLNQEIDQLRSAIPAPELLAEERVIQVVQDVSPAVVSIVLTKDVPVYERVLRDPFEDFFGGGSLFQIPDVQQNGTRKQEVGEGSGFFVSENGLIVTNKHVVLDDDVEYTVFTKNGKSYSAAVLARDPVQDVAVVQIRADEGETFPFVRLGSSDNLQIGQTVIAIGNALGEFSNTVSTGVISGLGRTITATDGGTFQETIEDVIQTDAAINRGNSGGPLLNLAGEVIGMNTATVIDAQSIGFAIPVNVITRDVEQVQEGGEIVYPFLGVQYIVVNPHIQEENNLAVDYGAFVSSGDGSSSIVEESAAEKAGLQDGDIIIEINNRRINKDNSLAKELQRYAPGDTVQIKVIRGEEERILKATLGKREE